MSWQDLITILDWRKNVFIYDIELFRLQNVVNLVDLRKRLPFMVIFISFCRYIYSNSMYTCCHSLTLMSMIYFCIFSCTIFAWAFVFWVFPFDLSFIFAYTVPLRFHIVLWVIEKLWLSSEECPHVLLLVTDEYIYLQMDLECIVLYIVDLIPLEYL